MICKLSVFWSAYVAFFLHTVFSREKQHCKSSYASTCAYSYYHEWRYVMFITAKQTRILLYKVLSLPYKLWHVCCSPPLFTSNTCEILSLILKSPDQTQDIIWYRCLCCVSFVVPKVRDVKSSTLSIVKPSLDRVLQTDNAFLQWLSKRRTERGQRQT